MQSILNGPRRLLRREMEAPTVWGALILGMLATLISFAVVDQIFASAVNESMSLEPRLRFQFNMPSHNLTFDWVCLAAATTAVYFRQWILPFVAGLCGYAFVLPMYGGSGAITQYMSLIFLHIDLLGVALVLNMFLAVMWIRESKRVGKSAGLLSRAPASMVS